MYWETNTDYSLFQGKRIVGTVEPLFIPIGHKGKPDGWRALYLPPVKLNLASQVRGFNNPADAKAWVEERLKEELPEAGA